MDILIFLGTLVGVLLGGFLLIKLVLHKRSSGRNAKHVSVPIDSRLKQRHTGRPYLRHQTFMRKEYSDEIWKTSRHKVNEPSWQNGSFTAHKIMSDAEKEPDSRKQREGLTLPVVEDGPDRRPSGVRAAKLSGQGH